MRLDEGPFVGSSNARALRVAGDGGTAVVLGGAPTDSLIETLGALGTVDVRRCDADPVSSLRSLADLASQRADRPLLLVAADLDISPVALLDLLDVPTDRTATLTITRGALSGPPQHAAPIRVSPHDRLVHSVGTSRHVVSNPTAYAIGVVRVRGADRERAAAAWREGAAILTATGLPATASTAAGPVDERDERAVEPFDLALLTLVRAGLAVQGAPVGPYSIRRGEDVAPGAFGSAWQQRLRAASRGNDGAFSMAVVRPVSRRLTAYGLGHGWTPNAVTIVSLLLGLAACALAATDDRFMWILAAVLLQASLVVDCVDGEIARFTRRYSAFGGWLDGVSDRIKEFAMVAAVAWVAVRRGEPLWMLAIVLLALLAIRHVEDYAYTRRVRLAHAAQTPDLVGLDVSRDLGPDSARTTVPSPPAGRAVAAHKLKQVLHLPVAERYLIMSLGLLTFSPVLFLWALSVAVALALLWTQTGRIARALARRDRFDPTHPDLHLGELLDLGLLAGPARSFTERLAGRRFAWQLPGLLLAAETAAVIIALSDVPDRARWVGYAWLVAVSWHRYDTVYRLREVGRVPASWVGRVTLGCVLRIVLLLVVATVGGPMAPILAWGALGLICAYAAESTIAWTSASRPSHRPRHEVTA